MGVGSVVTIGAEKKRVCEGDKAFEYAESRPRLLMNGVRVQSSLMGCCSGLMVG